MPYRPWKRSRPARTVAAAVLAVVVAAGCGDDGPTGPDLSGPNVVRIEDPSGLLAAHVAAIDSLVDTTLAIASTALPVTGVTITVIPDANRAIGGYGIGGQTPDAATVLIFIDPARHDLATILPARLPGMVAHELHHAIRWRNPGYGRTLLEAMVSEGLADRFAVELIGVPVPPWCTNLTPDEVRQYTELARPLFDTTNYGHGKWFFGDDPQIPRWTGYTLGHGFVLAYQDAHPGSTAAGLVTTRAEEFRPPLPDPAGRSRPLGAPDAR